jgi:hypothetical protein
MGGRRIDVTQFRDARAIRNASMEVVVSPRTGRIIGLTPVGGENVLWLGKAPDDGDLEKAEQVWSNYGGDKVWISPQPLWKDIMGRGWPPDTATDGRPWTVTKATQREVIMESALSAYHGVKVTRSVRLPDETATLEQEIEIRRVKANPWPLNVWTVSQVRLPECCMLDMSGRPGSAPYLFGRDRVPGRLAPLARSEALQYAWSSEKSGKVGTYGRWVAAVYEDRVLAEYIRFDPEGEYRDGSNCQIFVEAGKFMELELLSPTESPEVGGAVTARIVWKLLDRPKGADCASLVETIRDAYPQVLE